MVQGQNKGRDGIVCCIGSRFMVSLYILSCGNGIILFLVEIRPLRRLDVWEKLDCKYELDWPDGSEGQNHTRQGRIRWINGSKRQIESANIGF